MLKNALYTVIHYASTMVWLINGLFCKVLNLVPRHRQIVSEILSDRFAFELTTLIGLLEILIALWILTGYKSRFNTLFQMLSIFAMNLLEFWLVPELLLFGRINFLFAMLFNILLYFNEFHLKNYQTKYVQSI